MFYFKMANLRRAIKYFVQPQPPAPCIRESPLNKYVLKTLPRQEGYEITQSLLHKVPLEKIENMF